MGMAGIGSLGRINMRVRLTLLIAVAMLPLGVFLFLSIARDYDHTLSNARRDMLQTAKLGAERQAQIFATSRIVLGMVRRSLAMTNADGVECHDMLAKLKDANPQFLSIGVTNDKGLILCHSAMRIRDTIRDLGFVRRVLSVDEPDFVVGDLVTMRALNKQTVTVGVPMLDEAGRRTGVVFAGLDLDYLAAQVRALSEGGRRVVAIIQPATGSILAAYPSTVLKTGVSIQDHPLATAMLRAPNGGVVETSGLLGRDRIVGFVPVEEAETAGLMLAIGESRNVLLAPVRQTAIWKASIGVAVFLAAVAMAWWLGQHLQLRPIARLTQAAARIGAGDYAVRTRLEPWQSPELRGLGAALDRMAAGLAAGRDAERAVAASEARYRLLAENTVDLVTCVDRDGRRSYVSPACRELLGREPDELLGGFMEDIAHPDDVPVLRQVLEHLCSGLPVINVRHRKRHRDGHYVAVEVNGRAIGDGQAVLVTRDMTERRRMEENLKVANRQLAELAMTDGLTGLSNRRAFDLACEAAFAGRANGGAGPSLLLIDVDRFKSFNDRYGHLAGDDCLRRVAAELRVRLASADATLARYGGEEFAAVLPETALSGALQAADDLRRAVARLDLRHEGSEYGCVTISVGVATAGFSGATSGTLLHRADEALYAAKARGRNRVEASFMPAEREAASETSSGLTAGRA